MDSKPGVLIAPGFVAEFKSADCWLCAASIPTKHYGCIGYVCDALASTLIFCVLVPDLEAGKMATQEFVETLIGAPADLSWRETQTL